MSQLEYSVVVQEHRNALGIDQSERLRRVVFTCEDELVGEGSGSSVVVVGETMYGPSVLGHTLSILDRECAMHSGHHSAVLLREVGCDVVPIVDGYIPPCFGGRGGCTAQGGELAVDRQFVRVVLSGSVAGFAYLDELGLPGMKRYEKGSFISDVECVGGYAYLPLIRRGAMRRAARVLGPYPLDSDLLAVFRLVGRSEVDAEVLGETGVLSGKQVVRKLLERVHANKYSYSQFGAVVNVEEGRCFQNVFPSHLTTQVVDKFGNNPEWSDVEKVLSESGVGQVAVDCVEVSVTSLGRVVAHVVKGQTFSVVSDFLSMMNGWTKHCGPLLIGGGADGGPVFKPMGLKGCVSCSRCGKVGKPETHVNCSFVERALCEVCGFVVVVKDHEGRCRVHEKLSEEVKDQRVRAELVGDVIHRCDVVSVIVGSHAVTQYSVKVAEYVGNAAQRRYLEMMGDVIGDGYSDHSWGSYFERRYVDVEFRRNYLAWLWNDCGAGFEDMESIQSLAELQYDGGWASVKLQCFPFGGT